MSVMSLTFQYFLSNQKTLAKIEQTSREQTRYKAITVNSKLIYVLKFSYIYIKNKCDIYIYIYCK